MHVSANPDNLFLDGYIRLSADGAIATFDDYMRAAFPGGATQAALRELCHKLGIAIISLDSLAGVTAADQKVLPTLAHDIKIEREDRGTYRNQGQVDAEAEVLLIIRNLRLGRFGIEGHAIRKVYFVSQSRVLDATFQDDVETITWTPEALYRYIVSLPGTVPNADLLQECMLNDFYYAGVAFLDMPRYVRFFGPAISQARISYEEQKARYSESITDVASREGLDRAFEGTPDLQKPFFVTQMLWRIADHAKHGEQVAVANASASEAKVREAQRQLEKVTKERNEAVKAKRRAECEANRLRNLSDPKHQAKLARRAKNKKRKKKRKH